MSENSRPIEGSIHTDLAGTLSYGDYLGLQTLLKAQKPRSPHHDELLFIIIHQVYELWFKQMRWEAAKLQEQLEEGDLAASLSTLKRILTILKTLVGQIDILETMTPVSFNSFRSRLESASGFQSAQFTGPGCGSVTHSRPVRDISR